MFLLSAPKSQRYGYKEPRFYIDVKEEYNFTAMEKYKFEALKAVKQPNWIQTSFTKVRVIIFRNKLKNIVEKLDCSDMRFARSSKQLN